jgi:hypothetical protein
VAHVDHALQILCNHQLCIKCSKHAFGASKVEYVDHIVNWEGAHVDPKKIEAMKDWLMNNSSYMKISNIRRTNS